MCVGATIREHFALARQLVVFDSKKKKKRVQEAKLVIFVVVTDMSGAKRRSGYRKTVQDDVLHGLPNLGPLDSIAAIVKGAGSNLFEVVFADGSHTLAMLPSKFRKLVWLKRGDYVIVSGADGTTQTARGTAGAVTANVEHILYADAVRHLHVEGQWPNGLERERDAIIAIAPEGAAGDDEGENSDGCVGAGDLVGDVDSREQPEARRLQGLRGLPPETEEEECYEDEDEEEIKEES